MWRVDWFGNSSEFSRIFETEEAAEKFYNSLISRNKKIYSIAGRVPAFFRMEIEKNEK